MSMPASPPPNSPTSPSPGPSSALDPAARARRNRRFALMLAVVAVIFYVGIAVRWSWH